jgi:hypothetical protein
MGSPFADNHAGSRQWHTTLPSPLPSFTSETAQNRIVILAELSIVCNLFFFAFQTIFDIAPRLTFPPLPRYNIHNPTPFDTR